MYQVYFKVLFLHATKGGESFYCCIAGMLATDIAIFPTLFMGHLISRAYDGIMMMPMTKEVYIYRIDKIINDYIHNR